MCLLLEGSLVCMIYINYHQLKRVALDYGPLCILSQVTNLVIIFAC